MTDPAALLSALVAIPSVCRTPNGAIVALVRDHLARHGVEAAVLPGPEGDRANLFATIGPRDVPGIVLSGHLDVVPAGEGWTGDPFTLRQIGDRLVGRGAVDMKGFVACLLALVPEMVRAPLARPIHLALSYDEEVGCVGVRHMIDRLPALCAPPTGCIVGEPSEMRPVLRHKGKVAGRLTVRGRAGHSSRPDLADNAVHLAADLVGLVRGLHEDFVAQGPFHAMFTPPSSTLQVGVIAGGTGVNVVPDTCRIDWEARAVPGTDPMTIHDTLLARVAALVEPLRAAGREVAVESEVLSAYPALDLPDDAPLRGLAEAWSGHAALGAVSYGTEAGLFQAAGIPSIICGPGRIAEAHRPDESIGLADLEECCAMLRQVIADQR
ncbi:acetylornithine deacetylase [Methylobacterium indicum]|uniref:acetylornithine deacetylase n=1 Tax=Methylobacterium indicum TaxID=1775910 RepID=UPI0007344391|nr:acetylornithine deacetylase [Methylobacterium indicum]KTS20610.1 acetylornithine deacetylase [Methylobacterium indicum]KTS24913.1 acetylornithine deacetylase [Methylobacterium indicum]KTS45703.1 acetylornithine deacetylase [Methylobacterium indicum]